MGWFLINILLPVCLPLAYLLGAKLVDLPEPYASRTKLIRAVQDGQLGWVATAFAAASVHELLERLPPRTEETTWIDLVFALSCVLLAVSGFLAVLGTLFPLKESKVQPHGPREWIQHYRLFISTSIVTALSATFLSLAHYALSSYCNGH